MVGMSENPYKASDDERAEPSLLRLIVARLPWYGYCHFAGVAIFVVGNGFLILVENRLMAQGVPEAWAKLLTPPTELMLVGAMIALMVPGFVLERRRIKRGETHPGQNGPPMDPHRARQLVRTLRTALLVAVAVAAVGLFAVDRLSRP